MVGAYKEADRSIFNVHKILKRPWIGNFEWQIIVTYDIQPNLTKNAKLYRKR